MKNRLFKYYLICSILFALSLSACNKLIQNDKIETATTISSMTATVLPPATFTPAPTSTATQVPIPDYMNEYLLGGYDKKYSDQFMCFVIDESKIHVSPLGGIIYKERKIYSWVEVDYIVAGVLRHANVILLVERGGSSAQSEFAKFTFSNSGLMLGGVSPAFVEGFANEWKNGTKGDYPIVCGYLGLQTLVGKSLTDAEGLEMGSRSQESLESRGVILLFTGVFPVTDGVAQSITISGIGEVLPITEAFVIANEE